jgi:hypothetical protein
MPSISLTNPENITQLVLGTSSEAKLSGNIDLSKFNSLETFDCSNNGLTGIVGFENHSTLTDFDAESNQLGVLAINAILAAFVAAGASGGTLVLNGTGNAAPTGQGATDVTALQNDGWAVTTN